MASGGWWGVLGLLGRACAGDRWGKVVRVVLDCGSCGRVKPSGLLVEIGQGRAVVKDI